MMMIPVDDIVSFIPQKHPFVMVAKLLCLDENSARSSFIVTDGNVFVKDGVFQEAGLLENIAQTAALRAGYMVQADNKPVAVGYIGAINSLEIFNLPRVGDELVTEIVIENKIFDVTVISGKVWHNENLLASCEMKLFAGSE